MKKILFALTTIAISLFILPGTLVAQVMPDTAMAMDSLDEKTQKKVDHAREQLAKDQEDLTKQTAKFEKDKAKFEKDKAKGKLSPNDDMKTQKKLQKADKDIAKLKSRISENEAILKKYIQ
jgi:peptidoglycan hydrolase CwlO-like protein